MHEQTPDRLKKLRSGVFRKIDVVEIDLVHEGLYDKKFKKKFPELLSTTDIIDELEKALQSGPLWKFNPTCLSLFIIDNQFQYDKKHLENEVLCNGAINCKEIDRNVSLYQLRYTIRVLLINALEINDELISKSGYVCVDTLSGKMII